jgi:hypothetical protein
VLEQVVDLIDIGPGQRIELLLGSIYVVFANVAVAGELVQSVLGVPANVADGHPGVLGLVLGQSGVLAPPLFGQLRKDHP